MTEQTTHHALCWKAHPACCRARLDEALKLLEHVTEWDDGGWRDEARAFFFRTGMLVPSADASTSGSEA